MKFISLVFLVLVVACSNNSAQRKVTMYDGPPAGGYHDSMYLKGWDHGCQTGVASSADNVYRYKRIFKQDWQLAQDERYHTGWRDAYDYCRRKTLADNSR